MESGRTKVLQSGGRIVRKQLWRGLGEKRKSRYSGVKPSSMNKLRKRKRSDACITCDTCCTRNSTLKYYSNLIESSLPSRVLFLENNEWNDFPHFVLDSVRENFQVKNPVIEIKSDECHFLLDILYMVRWDLKTGLLKQIAWIDEEGRCYFPEVLLADNASMMPKACQAKVDRDPGLVLQLPQENLDIKLHLQIVIKGAPVHDLEGCVEDSDSHAKKIKIRRKSFGGPEDFGIDHNLDREDQASYVQPEEVDGGCQPKDKAVAVEVVPDYKSMEPDVVRDIFLTGMKNFGCVKLHDIKPCSDYLVQSRLELFSKQVEISRKHRGDPNVKYAWLASNKVASSTLMMYGLGAGGFTAMCKHGSAVLLTPMNDPQASAKICPADEEGLQYLVLCRVILGSVELVCPASNQLIPTSQSFDSGVDDLQNPHMYIVWSMNASTHIFPECLITFKITSGAQGDIIHGTMVKKDTAFSMDGKKESETPNGEAGAKHYVEPEGTSRPLNEHRKMTPQNGDIDRGSKPAQAPRSPWMPFPMLFEALSREISESRMQMVKAQYDLFLSKKITRDEFIRKLRSVVGDELLKSTILCLQRKLPMGSAINPTVAGKEQRS